jgi:Domain of unknown function (DUF1905)
MEWTFTAEVIEWRGPAPYLFVAMTPEESEDLKEAARGLIYWGQVPVHVTIGATEFTTALFPKDGRYLVPVKVAVQRAEAIGEGAIVEVVLRLNAARRDDGARRQRCSLAPVAAAGLLSPEWFSRCCPQPGCRSGYDQG